MEHLPKLHIFCLCSACTELNMLKRRVIMTLRKNFFNTPLSSKIFNTPRYIDLQNSSKPIYYIFLQCSLNMQIYCAKRPHVLGKSDVIQSASYRALLANLRLQGEMGFTPITPCWELGLQKSCLIIGLHHI